ncbi:MAG: hypothetical protein GWN18_01940 [Thermoplasmata archaeon]|nr:hypothetical protein [Thermoplasmata archaeon]NIS10772.1 hypothetical protein [Thermoplasmata archaeon]NIS18710.1 hypothetical protein [Thermoplasmata archaeon]NIT75728.1 hypothetical protein [Thermoplasmata archaeon]NIU47871.1 hypothetical protein [Thermoplasmata archaeon]
MERIYAEQGRRGAGDRFDSLNIKADDRRTPLRFRGQGNQGTGAIAFSGVDNASMFIAKGAYMNDNGSWVAEDQTAVIQEMNRDSTTPIMYRNTGLTIGQIFQPTAVGAVVTGTTPGGGGGVITPIPGGPETPVSVSVQAAEVELDFGETDKDYEVFEFPSVFELSTTARILMTPSARPATGRDEDEAEFDTFSCACIPFEDDGWNIRAYVHALRGVVVGPYRFTYTVAV